MAGTLAAKKAAPLEPGEFRFITKAVQMEAPGEDGKRRFKMVASSTIVDQGKDEIKLSALHDLENAFKGGLNIFTDHDHKVDNVFGRTDTATAIDSGERDPKTGAPIYDLHVAGVVNEPDPRMVRLADSIDGGYVTFGASIGAVVTEHQRNKAGGMDIYHVIGKEASLVGIPMNQRSWTYKAAKAAEALDTAPLDDEDELEETTKGGLGSLGPEKSVAAEAASELTASPATTNPDIANPDTAESDDAAASTTPEATDGQESELAPETPETASEDEDAEAQTDTPEAEKAAYPADEVKELLLRVSQLVTRIGEQDAEIADLRTKVATYEAQAQSITKEVDLAKEVIEKVMAQPLRSKTAGYVEDFTKTHSLFDPTIASYLDKRSKLTHD